MRATLLEKKECRGKSEAKFYIKVFLFFTVPFTCPFTEGKFSIFNSGGGRVARWERVGGVANKLPRGNNS